MEGKQGQVSSHIAYPSDGKSTVTIVVASSRVGQETIFALAANYASKVHIRAVFRSEENAQSLAQLHPSVEIFVGSADIFSQDVLVLAFNGAHKALIVAPQTEDRHLTVNKILDFAAQGRVAHVVLIGGVYQEEEKFLFHRQWQASRKHANTLGLKWTQLECSDFCENLYRSKESIRTDGVIHGAGAEGVSAPVALEDIGRAAALVLACEGCQYDNLGLKIVGPEPLSPLQIADTFSRVLGKPIRFVDIGVRKAREVSEKIARPSLEPQSMIRETHQNNNSGNDDN